MPRRLLTILLSALALLLAASPAALAAPVQAGPLAAAAVDDAPAEEEACSDDPEVELPACTDGWEEGGDGDAELCEADLSEEFLHASAAQEGEEWTDPEAGEEAWADDACEPLAAPALSALAVSVTGRGARTRLRVTFTLDGPGEVELTLARVEEGVTRGGRCAAAPAKAAKKAKNAKRHGKRGGKKCSRTVELRGSVVVDGDGGANATELRRRWGGRALAAGRYELTATPLDDGDSATTSFALAARSGR